MESKSPIIVALNNFNILSIFRWSTLCWNISSLKWAMSCWLEWQWCEWYNEDHLCVSARARVPNEVLLEYSALERRWKKGLFFPTSNVELLRVFPKRYELHRNQTTCPCFILFFKETSQWSVGYQWVSEGVIGDDVGRMCLVWFDYSACLVLETVALKVDEWERDLIKFIRFLGEPIWITLSPLINIWFINIRICEIKKFKNRIKTFNTISLF